MSLLLLRGNHYDLLHRRNFTFHYVSITTYFFQSNADVLLTLHSTMSLLLLIVAAIGPLLIMVFTFHYVSITTRTSQSPTLQSQFYHFLSTLSFSLLIEYKYQQYRKKISYFYSKIAYFSTSHVFCFITGRQL